MSALDYWSICSWEGSFSGSFWNKKLTPEMNPNIELAIPIHKKIEGNPSFKSLSMPLKIKKQRPVTIKGTVQENFGSRSLSFIVWILLHR